MGMEHYALARHLALEIASGAIRKRGDLARQGVVISNWDLAFEIGCDSTTAMWALRLLAESGLARKIGEKSYGAEIYLISLISSTTVTIPKIATRKTFLN